MQEQDREESAPAFLLLPLPPPLFLLLPFFLSCPVSSGLSPFLEIYQQIIKDLLGLFSFAKTRV